jgi:hypothetical protein
MSYRKRISPRKNKPISKRAIANETKSAWKQRYLEKIVICHKRNLDRVVAKLLAKGTNVLSSMKARSAKTGVKFELDIEDVREMLYESYGAPCKYCGRQMNIKNMVFDHIVPISKGGESVRSNLQVICKASNCAKGSLTEENFQILLDWIATAPEELRTDIMIRLSRGIH